MKCYICEKDSDIGMITCNNSTKRFFCIRCAEKIYNTARVVLEFYQLVKETF